MTLANASNQGQKAREKWDLKHADADGPGETARVLSENSHLLPAQGKALDLACGRGANSLQLAQAGLSVDAWDISPVAIQRLEQAVAPLNLDVHPCVRDVTQNSPEPNSFDIILVSHFLDRSLAGAIENALRPGGLLFYQTFNQSSEGGPRNQSFHLEDNELLVLFSNLKLRVYREESRLGNISLGWRGLSMLVAER